MSSATWSQAAQGSSTTFSRNKDLADLQAAATTYDSSSVTYDSASVYYDGYDPTTETPEGETGATWTRVSE